MSIRKLPLAKSPIVTYQDIGHTLAVTLTKKESESWLYSNFVNLWFKKQYEKPVGTLIDIVYPSHTHFQNPFLKNQRLFKYIFEKFNLDIKNFIIENINQGFYIRVTVDEYYIPGKRAYKNFHYGHDLMIFGYNSSLQLFYVLGYFNEIFTEYEVDMQSVVQGIQSTEDEANMYIYKPTSFPFPFDMKLFLNELNNYINSKNTYELYNQNKVERYNRVYGIEVYDAIYNYLSFIEKNSVNNLDMRIFSLMLEYKVLMNDRLKYFERTLEYNYNFSDLFKECNEVVSLLNLIKNLALKYNVTYNNKYIESIKLKLLLAKEKDIIFSNKLYQMLNRGTV